MTAGADATCEYLDGGDSCKPSNRGDDEGVDSEKHVVEVKKITWKLGLAGERRVLCRI